MYAHEAKTVLFNKLKHDILNMSLYTVSGMEYVVHRAPTAMKWVDTKNRLPPYAHQDYLVLSEGNRPVVAEYLGEGRFLIDEVKFYGAKVTHWAPMLPLPKSNNCCCNAVRSFNVDDWSENAF